MDFPNQFIESLSSQKIRYHVPTRNVRQSIAKDRAKRHQNLIGKYIILCDGISSNGLVYYQDQKISKGGYWTGFITNAKAFKTKKEALDIISSVRFNNPRIAYVETKSEMLVVYTK